MMVKTIFSICLLFLAVFAVLGNGDVFKGNYGSMDCSSAAQSCDCLTEIKNGVEVTCSNTDVSNPCQLEPTLSWCTTTARSEAPRAVVKEIPETGFAQYSQFNCNVETQECFCADSKNCGDIAFQQPVPDVCSQGGTEAEVPWCITRLPVESGCDINLGEPRWTYVCLSATQYMACDNGILINTVLEINAVSTSPGNRLKSICPSLFPSPPVQTVASLCYLSGRCRQVDEVWKQISVHLTLSPDKMGKVFDLAGKIWRSFEEVYPISLPAPVSVAIVPSGNIRDDPQVKKDLLKGKYDENFLAKVEEISKGLNINPLHLIVEMSFETGGTFSPSIKNPGSSATGLIQFMESTAISLGTTTAQLAGMNQIQQLEYVKKYFQQYKGIRLNNLGDIAMAVFWPAAIGKEDDYVLFDKDEKPDAYRLNPLDWNNDGKITRGEYVSRLKNRGYVLE